jgi:hypothetical protein
LLAIDAGGDAKRRKKWEVRGKGSKDGGFVSITIEFEREQKLVEIGQRWNFKES